MKKENIRNIAIIAHVDHGKTTLVDAFLKQNNVFRANQEEMKQEMILDSGALEREKGITIKAKNVSIKYQKDGQEYKINIVDTPGHADFGGEVERTLNMAEGCLLLVDAQEGPMPQTKFVLKKALELGLKPILVINKIDKPFADPANALDEVNNLFLELATSEEQLDFPVFYAIGRDGKAFDYLPTGDLSAVPGDMKVLLDKVIEYIPVPDVNPEGSLQMQITTLEYDSHIGRLLIGKVKRGKIEVGKSVSVIAKPGDEANAQSGRIKNIFVREGLTYKEVTEAYAGDIVAVSGIDSKSIGGTLCDSNNLEALPVIKISNPSVRVKFEANTSPFLGKEGKYVTAKLIQARLEKEGETNISLNITKADEGSGYFVAGRGELQLSILIEEMRREGFEFQVRRPEVIFIEEDGVKKEPLEELYIEVSEEYQGIVNAVMGERKAELVHFDVARGQARFTYKILTRSLLGLRNILVVETKGTVIMSNFLIGYTELTDFTPPHRNGVLIASEEGVAAAYSLNTIQERGTLFIENGTKVYEGMIVGINKYVEDLEVNVSKERAKSGVRRNQAEITQIILKPIKRLTLEFALVFIADDEILEITPENLRLRKQYLKKFERDWSKRDNLTDLARQRLGKA